MRKEWLPPYTTADEKMRGVAALPHFTNYNDNGKLRGKTYQLLCTLKHIKYMNITL